MQLSDNNEEKKRSITVSSSRNTVQQMVVTLCSLFFFFNTLSSDYWKITALKIIASIGSKRFYNFCMDQNRKLFIM